jgi:hypothetical protein
MKRILTLFLVVGLSGCGGGGSSSAAPVSLSAPANVQAEFTGEAVTLTWNSVSGAEQYHAYYGTDPDMTVANYAAYGGEWAKDVASPLQITIDPGPDYYFLVTASKGDHESEPGRSGAVFTRFSAVGDVVVDHLNKIEWQRCSVGQSWDGDTCQGEAARFNDTEARAYETADAEGWRLPDGDHLHSIVYCSSGDPSRFGPDGICQDSESPTLHRLFPNGEPRGHFSAPIYDSEGFVNVISFHDGWRLRAGASPDLAMIIRLSRPIQ